MKEIRFTELKYRKPASGISKKQEGLMDVALQARKHLPRYLQPKIMIVYKYGASYQELFKDLRNDECFKYLHLGRTFPITPN